MVVTSGDLQISQRYFVFLAGQVSEADKKTKLAVAEKTPEKGEPPCWDKLTDRLSIKSSFFVYFFLFFRFSLFF